MGPSAILQDRTTCYQIVRSCLGRPTMRTTYQLAATLHSKRDQSHEELWIEAIKSIVGWARQRCPGELAQDAWEGRDFVCEVPGHHVECVSVPAEGLWSLRLTHPDAPHMDRDAVPGRSWTTELALKRGETGIHQFGIRVFCTSQSYCDAEITLTRPKIVSYLADSFVLSTTRQLEAHPWYLNRDADLEEFYELVTGPQRVLPIYLLTEADIRRLPGTVRQYLLDERKLAQRTLGLAHVAVLPYVMSFAWTERVGKVWSAFQGAVRTYRAPLDFESDSPFVDHPLAMADNIILSRYKHLEGEEAFQALLADRAHQESAIRHVDWAGCLFSTDAKLRRAEILRGQANEEADWEALYKDEIVILEKKISEIKEERDEAIEHCVHAETDRDRHKSENDNLRWQIESLRVRLSEKTGEDPDASIQIPHNYDDLPDWVSKNLAARLVLHPRAIRAVRDASYQDVELVYRSLLLLANEYRNMKLSCGGGKHAFDRQVNTLRVECSLSIARERACEEGETYFVQYPSHTANKRFLDLHIRKGNSKDKRYCLAIYFFWDDITHQVVVGWLPSHLDNRLT